MRIFLFPGIGSFMALVPPAAAWPETSPISINPPENQRFLQQQQILPRSDTFTGENRDDEEKKMENFGAVETTALTGLSER